MATGQVQCWRCGLLIGKGVRWDLGHDDHDRTRYRGPEHQVCNRATQSPERSNPEPAVKAWW